jgi:flavin reductase (DIM6/NTAB) family NADH-FMN oxidoreductase RutF
MFSANQTPSAAQKDTVRNAEATGKFCWNLATYALREAVNITAEQVEYGVDEFERAGLEKVDARLVGVDVDVGETEEGKADATKKKKRKMMVPMVKRSPVRFECEHYSTLRLPGNPPMGAVDVVIGRVVGIHIDEGVLTDGKIDVAKTEPIARCGYYDYAVVRETFEMRIPGGNEAILGGLEGSTKKNRAILDGTEEGEGEGKGEGVSS